MASQTSRLDVTSRPIEGSRATRRLRRRGFVPGIVYGAGKDPQAFEIDARTLRNTLVHAGTLLEVSVDGGKGQPVIIKDEQRHPVRGEHMHLDLLRVRMDQPIQTTVAVELTGADEAPGVTEGGVLDHSTREVTVEALPANLPESLTYDVSGLGMNESVTLAALTLPDGVTLIDDPETNLASVMPPTVEPVEDEIETETAVVGEDGEPVAEGDEAGAGDGEGGESAPADES